MNQYIVFIIILNREVDNVYIEADSHLQAQMKGLEIFKDFAEGKSIKVKPTFQSIKI